MSKKVAVIGLGNTLRRDDGIGVIVLESLLREYKEEGAVYLNFGSASFGLLNHIPEYDAVLLIDGINAGLAAGDVKIFELKDVVRVSCDSALSSHELDLRNLFELMQALGLTTAVYVAGIQIQDVSFGEGLTEPLATNLAAIIGTINTFINQLLLTS